MEIDSTGWNFEWEEPVDNIGAIKGIWPYYYLMVLQLPTFYLSRGNVYLQHFMSDLQMVPPF